MIRRAIAVRYDRVEPSGRTEPLRIGVVTEDGEDHDAFLKPSGRPEMGVEGMANEALAAMLAADLGLPINEPFLVLLEPDFIASIPDAVVRKDLERSPRLCFASRDAGRQWALWNVGERLLSDRIPMALAITAFDAFIDNDDRQARKPNLLSRGDQFRIIDHELAFRLRMKLLPRPEPWKLGNLNRLIEPNGHVLAAKLLKTQGLDVAPIKGAWVGLSDVRLESYLAALPAEWADVFPQMREAIHHVKQVRDRIDECLAELIRVLT